MIFFNELVGKADRYKTCSNGRVPLSYRIDSQSEKNEIQKKKKTKGK